MCMHDNTPLSREENKCLKEENRLFRLQQKKEKAEKQRILDIIKHEAADLPNDFNSWMSTLFDRLMFYHKNGKNDYTGYCACGATVPLKKAKTGTYTECPVCKQRVWLRHDKYSYYGEGVVALAYLQKTSSGWMQRLFASYKTTYFTPAAGITSGGIAPPEVKERYQFYEYERSHIDTAGKYHNFHQKHISREWTFGGGLCHGMGWGSWCIQDLRINTYPKNLERLFANSPFQYSQLPAAAKRLKVNPFSFLGAYLNYPHIELLIKAGLYKLADQLCGYGEYTENIKAKNATLKELGIVDKRDVKEIARLNLGYYNIMAYRRMKSWDIPEEQKPEAVAFMRKVNDVSGIDFEYSFISNERLFKYWLEQKSGYKDLSDFYRDYRDYITDCIALKLNLNDTAFRTPKSLKASHAWTMDMVTVLKHQVFEVPVAAKYGAYRELVEWTDGNLLTVMAKNCEEILTEGKIQNHCVGRYCERVAKGESLLLFVRKSAEPDKPYYTLEIKPDMQKLNVAQCRGYHNEDPTPEDRKAVDAFLAKYTRWFNHRPAKGFDPDHIIAKYYKSVRKMPGGRYISNWDNKTEYKLGEVIETETDTNPDSVAVKGIHIASLDFAQKYGKGWPNLAILEVEVNLNDVIIPDAKDQIRTSRCKVLREVPTIEAAALVSKAG